MIFRSFTRTVSSESAGSARPTTSWSIAAFECLAIAALAICTAPGGAQAQELDNYIPSNLVGYDVMPGVTVTSRLRPEYDTGGIRFGSFLIRPEVNQSIGYDTNSNPGKGGSPVLITQGSATGETNWSRNNLNVDLGIAHFAYPALADQSYTNWSAGGGWSYEIGRDIVAIGVKHYDLNQLPVGIDSIGLVRPVPYKSDTARFSYKAVRGPWTFVPLIDYTATRFQDVAENSLVQATTGLDRNAESASLTTFYELAPQRSIVFVVRGTTAQYLTGQPRPNYNDVSVLTGLDYDITSLVRFRVLGGYEIRSYQNASFETHSSPVAEATVIWTPSGLTTVTASLIRRIEDANEAVQTGYTYTMGRVVVDHEYLRNVLLQGHAQIENASYLQSGDQQTFYGAGASATFLLNRNLRLSATYDYSVSRGVAALSSDYTRNVVMLQLRFAI